MGNFLTYFQEDNKENKQLSPIPEENILVGPPPHPSPYHYKNLHYSNAVGEQNEIKPLKNYKKSELTDYSNLKPKSFFSFYR